jgi:DNA (cytosine-5)-methyltransferase 1
VNGRAYYNELDPYAAQWLRNLISAGEIAPGDVDERSIVEVRADDLRGYTQAHFFAGIGGWSVALRLAGWPDDRPVWTGSCLCQPFSAAGAGKAADDERHLWPAWLPLIAECRPAVVFGEQVEAAVGWGWLDAVFADLEGEGYACGATVLPACGVGSPQLRQRLWFVAEALDDPAGTRCFGALEDAEANPRNEARMRLPSERRPGDGLADDYGQGWHWGAQQDQQAAGGLTAPRRANPDGRGGAFWSAAIPMEGADGTWRVLEPGVEPLAHGIHRRPSKLRAYGNAIVPQAAAEVIGAYLETTE